MDFQYRPGYPPQGGMFDPRRIPEQPKEKKMSAGIKVWRAVYPALIWVGFQIAVQFIFMFAYAISVSASAITLDPNELTEMIIEKANQNALTATLVSDLAAAAVMLIFYLRDKLKVDRTNPLNNDRVKNPLSYILTVFSSASMCIVFNIAVAVIVTIAIGLFGESIVESFNELSSTITSSPMVVQILSVVIVAPVCEELAMRGLMFKRLRSDMSFIWAALISSAVFGLIHGNWVQFVYAFGVGMLAAFVYEHTRNIIAPITLHVVANGVSTLAEAEWISPYFNNLMFGSTMLLTLAVGTCSMVTGLIAIKFISERSSDRKNV